MPISQAEAERILAKVKGDAIVIADPVADLEASGWENWLRTLMPFAFPSEFASFHREFWDKWWTVCRSIKAKKTVDPSMLNYLLLWGRALAKSSTGTPATLMKAAFAGRIYSLYLSNTIDQAVPHLANVRHLITHPDSRVVEFYPHLELDPSAATTLGFKGKDAEHVFITKGGSIFRAISLESASRGLIVGGKRPDNFDIDDIDEISDSVMVSEKKLQKLTRSILLTRDISSDLPVTTKILQNIVIETGVVNQIHSGRSDAFAQRTTIGVVNTFKHLDTESFLDENGNIRHRILPTSVPSWSAVSIAKAQAILDLIGLDSFLAECQNQFEHLKSGYVIPNYDEDRQVITWSMFEAVFGERRIPRHWNAFAGLDVGYTEGTEAHLSAWSFIATAAENSPLPGVKFLYRSKTFEGAIIDEQAKAIKALMWPGEKVVSWQMSHEKRGEMLTLRSQHDLPFVSFQYFKSEDGVAQWKSLSNPDRRRPHPFKPDSQDESGQWRLGCPNLYYIVDDDQLTRPINDAGLKTLRDQVPTWKWVTIKVTESGRTAQKPSKRKDDVCDSVKGVLALFGPQSADYSAAEKFERSLPATIQADNLAAVVNDPNVPQAEVDGLRQRRQIEVERAREREAVSQIPVHQTRFRIF